MAKAALFFSDRTFPINHGMLVPQSLYEKHPRLALNIYSAYRRAKEQVAAETRHLVETHLDLEPVGPGAPKVLRVDLYPYGARSKQQTLETLTQHSFEQGLTRRKLQLDEVFAPSTLDL